MEAVKLNLTKGSTVSDKSTSERVQETHTDEIVIGICSQLGAKKEIVTDELEIQLKEYGYVVEKIKMSKFIEITNFELQPGKTEKFSDLFHKIEVGNELREKNGSDYLANLAISQIALQKKQFFSVTDERDFSKIKSRRICYIIDSIKHTEELNTFRDVYKDIFYLISIYTPKSERVINISNPDSSVHEAEELIKKDQFEDNPFGQQVREVFVNADFFTRVDQNTEAGIKKKVTRYLNLIFGNGIETPTKEERAMYEAKSAAVNSACLSRQVGASIICKEGNLVSTGWNDVPKFGGNLYTNDDVVDNRCFTTGVCHNDDNKKSLMGYIIKDLEEKLDVNSILPAGNQLIESDNLVVKEKLSIFIRGILEKSEIRNLIEFSRSVHAEMHAIINAGNLSGNKIKGGTLFCTTYPCHNCARHIIAAGIEKVYYIEPYVKSKAPVLHDDSITDDETINDKVQLLVFDGVSPRRYLSFFNQNRPRKKLGKAIVYVDKKGLRPINSISLQALLYLEAQAAKRISDKQTNYGE